MKLPPDSTIAPEKITNYLLVEQPEGDKSGFLALAGYSLAQANLLVNDLRQLLISEGATLLEKNQYGSMYVIRGELVGPNGRRLRVRTIWMTEILSGVTKFITLLPDKGPKPK